MSRYYQFKQIIPRKYVRLTPEGSDAFCVFHMSAIDGILDEIENANPGAKYRIEIIEMTKEEFDALPEWGGW